MQEQTIDGMMVRSVIVDGREWHTWRRLSDGVQVQASMGNSAAVNGPEWSGNYILDAGQWLREVQHEA